MDNTNSTAIETRKSALKGFISSHAVSEEATRDCFNALTFDSYTVGNKEQVVVRNASGDILLTDNDILNHLRQTRPSYLLSQQRQQQLANVNDQYYSEEKELQQRVSDAAASGDIELFRKLRKEQGASLR